PSATARAPRRAVRPRPRPGAGRARKCGRRSARRARAAPRVGSRAPRDAATAAPSRLLPTRPEEPTLRLAAVETRCEAADGADREQHAERDREEEHREHRGAV